MLCGQYQNPHLSTQSQETRISPNSSVEQREPVVFLGARGKLWEDDAPTAFQMFAFGRRVCPCNSSSSPRAVMWNPSLRVQLTVWVEVESSSGKPISDLKIAEPIKIEFTSPVMPRLPCKRAYHADLSLGSRSLLKIRFSPRAWCLCLATQIPFLPCDKKGEGVQYNGRAIFFRLVHILPMFGLTWLTQSMLG